MYKWHEGRVSKNVWIILVHQNFPVDYAINFGTESGAPRSINFLKTEFDCPRSGAHTKADLGKVKNQLDPKKY